MLIFNDFFYTFDKNKDGVENWRCRKRNCLGRITFKLNYEIVNFKEHNHVEDSNEVQAYLTIQKKRNKTAPNNEKSMSIISAVTAQTSEGAAEKLPSRRAMSNSVNIVRNKILNDYKPKQLDIPNALHKNLRGEIFLRYDSGVEDQFRIVIFYSDIQAEILNLSTIWLVDCTFKSVPNNFSQFLTIHCEYLGKFIASFHALMKSKNENSYERVLMYFQKKFHKFSYHVIIDNEKALKNA